jgi:hypothetical protein
LSCPGAATLAMCATGSTASSRFMTPREHRDRPSSGPISRRSRVPSATGLGDATGRCPPGFHPP